jgi:glycosyltransferase involved in cell wall biosynthesis
MRKKVDVERVELSGRLPNTDSSLKDSMISIVIPVYNERATIEEILLRVQDVNLAKEIIIVDDASTDGTREFLEEVARHTEPGSGEMVLSKSRTTLLTGNIRVFFQAKNCGKGAALRRGFEEARGGIVIIQDADLEYDPQDFHKLIEPFSRSEADVVYGSRFLGGPHRVHLFWHYVGNKLLTLMSDIVTDLNLSDVWTCYKAFKREVLAGINIEENRFGFEQEITIKIAQQGWCVYEVPIGYYGRTYAEGKKITWKDGFRALWCILHYSLSARRAPARRSQAARESAARTTTRTAE